MLISVFALGEFYSGQLSILSLEPLYVQSNRPQKPFPIPLLLVGEHRASQKCNGTLRGN